jgi:hypothetical protein
VLRRRLAHGQQAAHVGIGTVVVIDDDVAEDKNMTG